MNTKPTLNVKRTLSIYCYCQYNLEKWPGQHYLYFERISENMIISENVIMLISLKRIFFKMEMHVYM